MEQKSLVYNIYYNVDYMWLIIVLTQSYIVLLPEIHTAMPNADSFTAKYIHNQKHCFLLHLKVDLLY